MKKGLHRQQKEGEGGPAGGIVTGRGPAMGGFGFFLENWKKWDICEGRMGGRRGRRKEGKVDNTDNTTLKEKVQT